MFAELRQRTGSDWSTLTIIRNFKDLTFDSKYLDIGSFSVTVPLLDAIQMGLGDQSVIEVAPNGVPGYNMWFGIDSTSESSTGDGSLWRTLSGKSIVNWLSDALVYPSSWPTLPTINADGTTTPVVQGHGFQDATPGNIMRTLIARAQERGGLGWLDASSFTGTTTSDGVAWATTLTNTYANGTTLLQVLQDLVSRRIVQFRMNGMSLEMFNYDTQITHHTVDEVLFRRGLNITEQTATTDSSASADTILIEGDNTFVVEVSKNLITNGTFETDTVGWSTSGSAVLTRDVTDAKFGNASGKMATSDGASYIHLTSPVAALVGLPYSATVWAKGTGTLELALTAFPGGTEFATQSYHLGLIWLPYYVSGNLPSAASSIDLRIKQTTVTFSNIWLDGIILEQSSGQQLRRREKYVGQGGITDIPTLTFLGQAELLVSGHDKLEETLGVLDSVLPWQNFDVGDWAWEDKDGLLRSLQIMQIAGGSTDANNLTIGLTLGDVLDDQDNLLQRKIDNITGADAGSYGALPNSIQDYLGPSAPSGLNEVATAYRDANGLDQAQVTFSWAVVSTNNDGTPIQDLDRYEVQYKVDGSTNWTAANAVPASGGITAAYISGLPSGKTFQAQVRAVDTDGNASSWTSGAVITLPKITTLPVAPSTPTTSTQFQSILVSWDGKDNTGTAYGSEFSRCEVHIGTVDTFTPDSTNLVSSIIARPGTTLVSGLAYDTEYFVKLVAVDKSGNASTESAPSAATTAGQLSDPDLPDRLITGAKIAENTITGGLTGNLALDTITADNIVAGSITTGSLTVSTFTDEAVLNGTFDTADSGTDTGAAKWVKLQDPGSPSMQAASRVTTESASGGASMKISSDGTHNQWVQTDESQATSFPDIWYVHTKIKASRTPVAANQLLGRAFLHLSDTDTIDWNDYTQGTLLPINTWQLPFSQSELLPVSTDWEEYEAQVVIPDHTPAYKYCRFVTGVSVDSSLVGTGLVLNQSPTGNYATTPAKAAFQITDVVDIRFELAFPNSGDSMALLYHGIYPNMTYSLSIGYTDDTPHLTFRYSNHVSDPGNLHSVDHPMPELANGNRMAVRAVLTGNDGSGNHVYTFYTADSIDGTYTQHGSAHVFVGALGPSATNIGIDAAETSEDLYIGTQSDGVSDPFVGTIYAMELRSGTAGTVVASPNFSGQSSGFSDAQGNVWTYGANAFVPGQSDGLPIDIYVDDITVRRVGGTATIADASINDAKIANVSADKLTAGSVNAQVIVGGEITTATSGARVTLDSAGLHTFDASGQETLTASAGDGSVSMTGQLIIPTDTTFRSGLQYAAVHPAQTTADEDGVKLELSQAVNVAVDPWPKNASGQSLVLTVASFSGTGLPTGGTWSISYQSTDASCTTSALPYNATAAQIQTALQALPAIGSGNVTVTGSSLASPGFTITFTGARANIFNSTFFQINIGSLVYTGNNYPVVATAGRSWAGCVPSSGTTAALTTKGVFHNLFFSSMTPANSEHPLKGIFARGRSAIKAYNTTASGFFTRDLGYCHSLAAMSGGDSFDTTGLQAGSQYVISFYAMPTAITDPTSWALTEDETYFNLANVKLIHSTLGTLKTGIDGFIGNITQQFDFRSGAVSVPRKFEYAASSGLMDAYKASNVPEVAADSNIVDEGWKRYYIIFTVPTTVPQGSRISIQLPTALKADGTPNTTMAMVYNGFQIEQQSLTRYFDSATAGAYTGYSDLPLESDYWKQSPTRQSTVGAAFPAWEDSYIGGTLNVSRLNASELTVLGEHVPPTGSIIMFGGAKAKVPFGYLWCDGTAVSREIFAELFDAIGTAFGAGDGSTTFNLPNLVNNFPQGAASTSGATGGAATHTHPLGDNGWAQVVAGISGTTLIVSQRRVPSGVTGYTESVRSQASGGSTATPSGQSNASALGGATDAASTLPPYVSLGFLIKY